VCVCVCACVCACMYACVYACVFVCVRVYVCLCMSQAGTTLCRGDAPNVCRITGASKGGENGCGAVTEVILL